jgi:DNA-binding transcriptional MerR regulator
MKSAKQLVIAGLVTVSLTAFCVVENILSRLDIAEQDAKEYIFRDFEEGSLSFPYSTALKKLATGERGAAVKEIGDYIRKYASSPAFAEQYKQTRESNKPEAPANKQEKLKKRIEELKGDIVTTEKDMKSATGDIKKLYEATLQMQRTELKALQDPKDPQHAMFTGDISGNDMDETAYKERLADFDKQYPATVKELVKTRLKEFLAMTADMDFNAQLVDRGGRKRFADPKLEAKDDTWKRCFRSGKETMTAARAYAQQWLKELN